MAKFCTKCGNKLINNVKFCPKCGNAVNDAVNTVNSTPKTASAQHKVEKPVGIQVSSKRSSVFKYFLIGGIFSAFLATSGYFAYDYLKYDVPSIMTSGPLKDLRSTVFKKAINEEVTSLHNKYYTKIIGIRKTLLVEGIETKIKLIDKITPELDQCYKDISKEKVIKENIEYIENLKKYIIASKNYYKSLREINDYLRNVKIEKATEQEREKGSNILKELVLASENANKTNFSVISSYTKNKTGRSPSVLKAKNNDYIAWGAKDFELAFSQIKNNANNNTVYFAIKNTTNAPLELKWDKIELISQEDVKYPANISESLKLAQNKQKENGGSLKALVPNEGLILQPNETVELVAKFDLPKDRTHNPLFLSLTPLSEDAIKASKKDGRNIVSSGGRFVLVVCSVPKD